MTTQQTSPVDAANDGIVQPETVAEPEISVGMQLRAAREQQHLTVSDVAQRLKFAPRQIEALEADNHTLLPGLTFIRGFVRSYSRLLGLDGDLLVGVLERAAARDVGPSTVQLQSLSATPQRFPMRSNSNSGSGWPWMLAMLVAVIGLGGFTLYQWQAPEAVTRPAGNTAVPVAPPNIKPLAPASDAVPADGAANPANAASTGAAVSAPAVGASSAPVETSPGAVVAPAPAAKPEAAGAAGAATPLANPAAAKTSEVAKGNGKIHLVFSEESWTEIRQAGGRVVFSQQSGAGSEAWVDGQPPFDFVIGNAGAVKLFYRGNPVELGPYTKVSVARLQLK